MSGTGAAMCSLASAITRELEAPVWEPGLPRLRPVHPLTRRPTINYHSIRIGVVKTARAARSKFDIGRAAMENRSTFAST